jgi:hypothetical protein
VRRAAWQGTCLTWAYSVGVHISTHVCFHVCGAFSIWIKQNGEDSHWITYDVIPWLFSFSTISGDSLQACRRLRVDSVLPSTVVTWKPSEYSEHAHVIWESRPRAADRLEIMKFYSSSGEATPITLETDLKASHIFLTFLFWKFQTRFLWLPLHVSLLSPFERLGSFYSNRV